MRIARILAAMGLCASATACVLDPGTARPWSGQTASSERIDPYHRDNVPDTPYEVRKGEMERDDHLAGRTSPSYPPLFKDQQQDEAEGGQ